MMEYWLRESTDGKVGEGQKSHSSSFQLHRENVEGGGEKMI